jgi:spoIIIJ-associated protein
MKSIIVEADTIKKAIKMALEKLGTTKDRVSIEILREEKKGLFDMESSSMAKIRVRIKK